MAERRLTDRQAAVLAVVERIGRPVMADLWREFPDLAPSAIKRVLDSLERKGLVDHAGDEGQAFVGGVHWWSTAVTPTAYDEELEAIVAGIEAADLGLRHTADPHARAVTVFLPLTEVEWHLHGLPTDTMDALRACLAEIEAGGVLLSVSISTEIASRPEPLLAVQVRPASEGRTA
jgi:hypothetical protein